MIASSDGFKNWFEIRFMQTKKEIENKIYLAQSKEKEIPPRLKKKHNSNGYICFVLFGGVVCWCYAFGLGLSSA
jgi:hypothetical protein